MKELTSQQIGDLIEEWLELRQRQRELKPLIRDFRNILSRYIQYDRNSDFADKLERYLVEDTPQLVLEYIKKGRRLHVIDDRLSRIGVVLR